MADRTMPFGILEKQDYWLWRKTRAHESANNDGRLMIHSGEEMGG